MPGEQPGNQQNGCSLQVHGVHRVRPRALHEGVGQAESGAGTQKKSQLRSLQHPLRLPHRQPPPLRLRPASQTLPKGQKSSPDHLSGLHSLLGDLDRHYGPGGSQQGRAGYAPVLFRGAVGRDDHNGQHTGDIRFGDAGSDCSSNFGVLREGGRDYLPSLQLLRAQNQPQKHANILQKDHLIINHLESSCISSPNSLTPLLLQYSPSSSLVFCGRDWTILSAWLRQRRKQAFSNSRLTTSLLRMSQLRVPANLMTKCVKCSSCPSPSRYSLNTTTANITCLLADTSRQCLHMLSAVTLHLLKSFMTVRMCSLNSQLLHSLKYSSSCLPTKTERSPSQDYPQIRLQWY